MSLGRGGQAPGAQRARSRLPRGAGLVLCSVGLLAGGGLRAQSDPPAPLPARPLGFPAFEDFTLENGLRVVLVPHGTEPLVSVRLYARGGRALDPPELSGLASLTATLLTRGTEARSAAEISFEIEGVGASLSANAGRDFLSISTLALTEHAEVAVRVLADVVQNATFPVDEVDLARGQMLSGLQAELGDPQAIASRRFAALVYGAEHPYGTAPTPETVERIRRGDLLSYQNRVLSPGNALLLVAGRIDGVEALARRHFGSWGRREAAELTIPDVPEPAERRIYLVHRPGASQSVVSVGHLGIMPENPDYFPLVVVNKILGVGADSRLFRVLREERGWTYAASSQFTRGIGHGSVLAQASVRTEVTDSTVVEMLNQMERLGDEPVPADELDGAVSFLAGSFPLRLETADQVADQLAGALLLGLPVEDVTRFPERIRSVTSGEVERVARERLHPDRAVIVVVGDAVPLLERLEAIAPVELLDVDGSRLSQAALTGIATTPVWDGERLEPGERSYAVLVEGTALGTAEYRLERDGADWVSIATISAPGTTQRTRLRFGARGLAPLELVQEISQGAVRIAADLRVTDGRLVGAVELPATLGGPRRYDQELTPGTLLAGLDEYALAVAPLEEGARFPLPYLDLTRGEVTVLDARVTGVETLTVPAGTFATWRVEVAGGGAPAVLFLRLESPHILVRQELAGASVRYDLVELDP